MSKRTETTKDGEQITVHSIEIDGIFNTLSSLVIKGIGWIIGRVIFFGFCMLLGLVMLIALSFWLGNPERQATINTGSKVTCTEHVTIDGEAKCISWEVTTL